MLIASVGKRLSCLATLLLFHFRLFCALSSVHCLRVLFAFLLGVSLDFRRTGCLCFATCSLHSFHTSQSFFLSMFFVDVCNRISSSLFYGFCSAALKYFHSCSLSNVARTSSIEFCVISPR